MKELVLKITQQIIEKRKTEGRFPDGADALEIQRQIHAVVQNTLTDLETEGILTSYPTVNGIKVYSFKTQ